MKNYFGAGATLLALLVVGIISVQTNFFSRGQSAAAGSQDVIQIGFMAPLTGPFPDWGESIRRGMELAVEDTHHTFDVDYQDDSCSAEKGIGTGREMINVRGIRLIIGPGCSDVLQALAPIADQEQAMLFSTGLLSDAIFSEHQSVMNFATQISTEAKYMAAYLESQNVKKVAFVHGTNDFGAEFGKRFPSEAKKRGMDIVFDAPESIEATDFRTTVAKIVRSKPDAVFMHQGEKQIGIIVKQLRQAGFSGAIYAYYGAESGSALAAGGKSMEGLHYTFPVNSSENSDAVSAFNKRYTQKYGATPTATALFVYDGMMILDKALDRCAPTDTACIKNFFVTLGNYKGLSGDMKFNPDGSITRPFGIKQIKDGEFVWVTKEITL